MAASAAPPVRCAAGAHLAGRVLPVGALFPPKGHRYFTEDRIEALRQQVLAAGDGDVTLPALTLVELICDWRNMAAVVLADPAAGFEREETR